MLHQVNPRVGIVMKKIRLSKLIRKSAKQEKSQLPARITNETVAEHREQILAGGRRFKYPVQYARHKLVRNAVIIAFVSVVLLGALVFQQLYFAQNSGDFIYRITQLLPLPVATVANEPVRYSDYLMQYRASEYWLRKYDEIKLDSEDGKRLLEGVRRQVMDTAEANAFATKLAREKGITVTDKDVDDAVARKRNTANGQITQEAYDTSTMMLYGWSPDDYRQAIKQSLLRSMVAFAMDSDAQTLTNKASSLISSGKDLQATAQSLGGGITVQSPGLVDIASSFNGLNVSDVAKLQPNVISGALKSGTDDGYYFVRVTQKTDNQVNFDFIQIKLTAFNAKLAELKKSNQIHEFIKLDKQS